MGVKPYCPPKSLFTVIHDAWDIFLHGVGHLAESAVRASSVLHFILN